MTITLTCRGLDGDGRQWRLPRNEGGVGCNVGRQYRRVCCGLNGLTASGESKAELTGAQLRHLVAELRHLWFERH